MLLSILKIKDSNLLIKERVYLNQEKTNLNKE